VFEPAIVEFHAKKTMFQQYASKLAAKFIVDESRQENVCIGKMGLE
jgi:hypothetical protein